MGPHISIGLSEHAWNPAFHAALVGTIGLAETGFQALFVAQHARMKPARVEDEKRQGEPRGKRDRQSQHEDEMPEIHRVAQITVSALADDAVGRRLDAGPTAATRPTSKGDRGIVTFDVSVVNQHDEVCQDGQWLVMFSRAERPDG